MFGDRRERKKEGKKREKLVLLYLILEGRRKRITVVGLDNSRPLFFLSLALEILGTIVQLYVRELSPSVFNAVEKVFLGIIVFL